ncbi:MAG: hypothetical protein H7201_14620 [Candidatus Saccharibacteria bacterium]|nr:hypothetical protein [Microbacteriaceae bacterium]
MTPDFRKLEDEISAAKRAVYEAEHVSKRAKTSSSRMEAMAAAKQTAVKFLEENASALASQQDQIEMRVPYQMIPKGRRDSDGFQRFSYPPFSKMLVGPPASYKKKGTITVPPTLPFDAKAEAGQLSGRKPRAERGETTKEKQQPIKHWQNYAYKRPEWRGYYGMRSLVEASNSLLKTKDHGDIESPAKRSGRGYAATYLALAYSVVTSNLKRIATFFANEALRIEHSKVKHRTRRRTDNLGRPLAAALDDGPPGLKA